MVAMNTAAEVSRKWSHRKNPGQLDFGLRSPMLVLRAMPVREAAT
jgi:hypothetical protein